MTRYTLGGVFKRSGVGLHSGISTSVQVLPAATGEGRYFVRVDLLGSPIIPARVDAVCETTLSTELQASDGDARVRTVEHLLAALAGSGVDDARIEIDGAEVPLLDGSARLWAEAIRSVGVVAEGGVPSTSNLPLRGTLREQPPTYPFGERFANNLQPTPSGNASRTTSNLHPSRTNLGLSRGCLCCCLASTNNPIYLRD